MGDTMKKTYLVIMAALCVISETVCTDADAQISHVINNTNQPAQVGFTLPEQHRADIGITKIKSSQEKLHAAILKDSAVGIREAIKEGADINIEKNGKSPIMWAILLSRYKALETLLQLGAIPNDECGKHATKIKDIKALLLLANHSRINFDIKEVVALVDLNMCLGKDLQIVADFIKKLIIHGYEVNEFWEPIIRLSQHKSVEALEMIQFILFRGANPNHIIRHPSKGCEKILMTPLLLASVYYINKGHFQNKQIVKMLIEAGADVNQNVNSHSNGSLRPLISHVIERHNISDSVRQEIIELLLEHGATL